MGDEDFKTLYLRLGGSIFTYAARRVSPDQAMDVVNNTFEVVLRKRDRSPVDPTQWPAWIMGIAKNQVLQEAQRAVRKHHDNRFIDDFAADQHPSTPDIADLVAFTATGRAIWLDLTPAERQLLDVASVTGLSSDEAAALLGISKTAYTTRISRLRRRLSDLCARHNGSSDREEDRHSA